MYSNRTLPQDSPQRTAEVVSEADAHILTEASSDHEQDGPRNETSITRWPFFPIALVALVISIVTSVVILALASRIITIPTHLYLSEHKRLYQSWTAKPFIDITVESGDEGCQAGYEPLLYRQWQGTPALCFSQATSTENHSISTYNARAREAGRKDVPLWQDGKDSITFFNDACRGWKLDALPAQNLTELHGVTFCGKRAQKDSLYTVRVSPRLGQRCPEQLLPCIEDQVAAETSCVTDLSQCPILDFKVVESNAPLDNRYVLVEPAFVDSKWRQLSLAYSKTASSSGDFQPIVGTEPLTNLKRPCFGPNQGHLVIDEDVAESVFLPIETDDTKEQCESYSWRYEDKADDAHRYSESLLSTNLFELQNSNGILSSLMSIHGGLVEQRDLQSRQKISLNWIASRRYWWDIACEDNPETSSASFFQTLQKIPTYFELHDQETMQPTFGLALDDTRESEIGFFSFREKGLAPAVAKTRIQSDVVAILLYQIFVGMVLLCHVMSKPRIQDTKTAINKVRRNIYLIWSPLLLLCLLAQLYVALTAYLAENFEKHWLEMLRPKRDSYACSLKSLYIDHDEVGKILKTTLEDEKSETIIALSFSNMILLTVQMLSHCQMMMRWYRENPKPERRTKRSIKVGLPVESNQQAVKAKVDVGHAIPEADRRANPDPIKFSLKVLGIPLQDLEEQGANIETPLASGSCAAASSFSSMIKPRDQSRGSPAQLPLPRSHYGQPAIIYELGDAQVKLVPPTQSMQVPRPAKRDILIDFQTQQQLELKPKHGTIELKGYNSNSNSRIVFYEPRTSVVESVEINKPKSIMLPPLNTLPKSGVVTAYQTAESSKRIFKSDYKSHREETLQDIELEHTHQEIQPEQPDEP